MFFNDEELDNIRDRFPFTVKARFKKDTSPEEIGKSMAKGGFKGGFRITAVTRFQVIIVFNQHGDYLRMLSKRSWTVNGIQLSISKWDPSTEDKHDSHQALIWVTLKHLPFFLLDKRNLFSVVKALGNPIMLDDTTARGGYYQTARVLVEMDATKPKISSIQVSSTSWVKTIVVVYDPPLFSKFCKRWGHCCTPPPAAGKVLTGGELQSRHRATTNNKVSHEWTRVERKGKSPCRNTADTKDSPGPSSNYHPSLKHGFIVFSY
ncbi:unnamed protein product [Cuscuta campestris]|uniref:Uncharacterized protein n=1 Tax=Cuscuta campestris TaxID=132261 RepID=A0A484MF16_9ASTE|nr:unnamed protein product [Cuscuta campestris]